MKRTKYIYALGLGLTLPLMADTAGDGKIAASKGEPVEEMVETTDVVVEKKMTEENVEKSSEARIKQLEKEIEMKEEQVEKLREQADNKEEKAEETREYYEGNANHARDLIKAETDVLLTRLEKLQESIKQLEDNHIDQGYASLDSEGSFTYEDKMALVKSFLADASGKVDQFVNGLSLDQAEDKVEEIEK